MTGHSGMRKGLRRVRRGWDLESLPHKKTQNRLSLSSMSIQFLTAQKLFSEKLSVSRPEINQRIISLLKA